MDKFAKVIKATGEEVAVTPKNGTDFSLEELQTIVGGYIEIVYDKDGNLIVLDSEGKFKDKGINAAATSLYGNPYDVIVGNVLYCSPNFVK